MCKGWIVRIILMVIIVFSTYFSTPKIMDWMGEPNDTEWDATNDYMLAYLLHAIPLWIILITLPDNIKGD